MIKILLLIIATANLNIAISQDSYFRFYSAIPLTPTLIQLESGNILTGMINPLYNSTGVSLMSSEGNYLYSRAYSHEYSTESTMPHWRIKRFSDNEFYFTCPYMQDTCLLNNTSWSSTPALGKMDSLGNIISFRRYELTVPECWHLWLDLEVLSDRSAILWGRGTSFFAIHADSVSVHWAKRINAIGSFQVIKELPSGGYVAGINMETAGAVIARLSEGGDFLWCKSYFRPKGMISDILVESDSSFVIVGFTDTVEVGEPISFPYDQDLFLMNLDGQGNIQWTNCYQNTVPWYTANGTKLIRAWDGNYIVLVSTAFPNVNWSRFPTILKLSTTGELIWNRSYGVDDFQYGPYTAILAHSDGGYMIQGSVNGDPQSLLPYGGYIIKTDSIGHISCFERFGSVIETVEIFPVDSSFTMTSSDGAVAYESFVQDAPTGEILEADACLYNALREEDGGASYTLFPNPTTGKVTLRCIMPTDADAIIRMVDPLGKLMSTTLLVAGSSSQEVDLSSFANGVYFLIISGINDSYIQRIVLDK